MLTDDLLYAREGGQDEGHLALFPEDVMLCPGGLRLSAKPEETPRRLLGHNMTHTDWTPGHQSFL